MRIRGLTLAAAIAFCFFSGGCSEEKKMPDAVYIDAQPTAEIKDTFSEVGKLKDRFFTKTGNLMHVIYRWQTGENFVPPEKPLTVFVHFLNYDGKIVWQEDHAPDTPVTEWKPDQTIQYERLIKIPEGLVTPHYNWKIGFYDLNNPGKKYAVKGQEGEPIRKALLGKFFIEPMENAIYKSGWYQPEFIGDQSFRWSQPQAVYEFKNPHQTCFAHMTVGTQVKCFENPPVMQVRFNGETKSEITLDSENIPLSFIIYQDELDEAKWQAMEFESSAAFVPKDCGVSDDERLLGIYFKDISVDSMHFAEGWHPAEKVGLQEWRWSDGDSIIEFGNPEKNARLVFKGGIDTTAGDITITCNLNDKEIGVIKPGAETFTRIFNIDRNLLGEEKIVRLHLKGSNVFRPADKGGSDTRKLSFRIFYADLIPVKS